MNFLEGLQPIPVPSGKGKSKSNLKKIKLSIIKETTPVFSYRYLSLDSKEFCYNNPNIDKEDFFKLFEIKKELSRLTFHAIDNDTKYHFHLVQNEKVNSLLVKFKSSIKKEFGPGNYELPDIYQFAVYSGTGEDKAPRVFGFIGTKGIFNIVWLDLYHKVYPATAKRTK